MTEQEKDQKMASRDYDREINEVFDEALKHIDPELMKTIQYVAKLNEDPSNKLEVTSSYTGTTK